MAARSLPLRRAGLPTVAFPAVARTDRLPLSVLALVAVLARVLAHRAQPFDGRYLAFDWHLLDVELLRADLLRSLWFLHAQPPLWNLVVGLALKTGDAPFVLSVLLTACGLCTAAATYALARSLGGGPWPSAVAAGVGAALPPHLGLERVPMPVAPLALFVVAAALGLRQALVRGSPRWFALFAFSAAGAVLTKPTFHVLAWLAPVLLLGLVAWRVARLPRTRTVLGIAVAALLLAAVPYAKNAAQVGEFSSSTWFGMNIARTLYYVEPTEIKAMVAQGQISPAVLVEPFATIADYGALAPAVTGPPVVSAPLKAIGATNYDDLAYVALARADQAAAERVIAAYPTRYLWAVTNQAYILLGFEDYRRFGDYGRFTAISPGVPPPPSGTPAVAYYGLRPVLAAVVSVFVAPLAVAALLCVGLHELLRRIVTGLRARDAATWGACAFLAFTVAYVVAVGCFLEFGEADLARATVDPLLLVGGVLAWEGVFRPDCGLGQPRDRQRGD